MKKIFYLILPVVLLCQACKDLGSDPVPEYYNRDTDVMKMLKERVDFCKKDVGIVVGIINGDETRVYSYGQIDKNKSDVPDGNTIYEIGSISKTFTCTILADMVLKREIGLDDPAQKYLPENIKVPTFNGKQITLRHLATHTSGLPRDPENFTDPQSTTEQFFGSLLSFRLTRSPGSQYEYSNFGVTLLGYILSKKAGMDYPTLLKERILDPLGMNDTYVNVPASALSRYATPYNSIVAEASPWNIADINLSGAGAIKSTINDVLKYMAANIGMVQTSLDAAIQYTHNKLVCNIIGPGWSIGLGWHILDISGTEYITHGGATYGFATSCYFDPVNKLGALVFTNSRAQSDTKDDVSNFCLYNIIANEKSVRIDPAILDDYIGTFRSQSNFTITFTREGNCLFAETSGYPKYEIYPESKDKFFWANWDATVSFFRNSNGKVYSLQWKFGDKIFNANKVN